MILNGKNDSIINVLCNCQSFIGSTGTDIHSINESEQLLGTTFAEDYAMYLNNFGIACFDGHELTGICSSSRLNVVNVTLFERSNNPSIPGDWYVIEQANIDGIVLWQNSKGEVYLSQSNTKGRKIADSFTEYISMCQI